MLFHHLFEEKNKELKTKRFVDKDEKSRFEEELKKIEADAQKSENEIKRFKEKAQNNKVLDRVIKVYEKEYTGVIEDTNKEKNQDNDVKTYKKEKKDIYLTSELSKLKKTERKIVERIYAVIKDVMPPDTSDELIKKIQSELKK